MKIKKVIHELSDTTHTKRIEQANLHFFKFFSLSIWLIIISIALSLAAKAVQAGTENTNLYYRYVPYEGPKSAAGKTNQAQPPKQSSGANAAESPKPVTGEQAPGAAAAKQGEDAKKTSPGEPAKQANENIGTGTTNLNPQESKVPSTSTGNSDQAPAPGNQTGNTGQGIQPPASQPKAEASTTGEQKTSGDQTGGAVKKSENDTAKLPAFSEIDKNGDHYVTKDELQGFPELLRVFDKVDAGKDGKLEQHEFQNLEMETKREGEVS
ncbi:MAG: hypothetical protein ACXWE9_05160 [Methylobacter sp.]